MKYLLKERTSLEGYTVFQIKASADGIFEANIEVAGVSTTRASYEETKKTAIILFEKFIERKLAEKEKTIPEEKTICEKEI